MNPFARHIKPFTSNNTRLSVAEAGIMAGGSDIKVVPCFGDTHGGLWRREGDTREQLVGKWWEGTKNELVW
jgi:hypothetical protein